MKKLNADDVLKKVMVYLTPHEHKKIVAFCEKTGRTYSGFFRTAGNKFLIEETRKL